MTRLFLFAIAALLGTASAQTAHDRAEWVDTAAGSEWNLLGESVAGPLKGRRLPQLDSGVHFAFAWLAFNPASEIVRELR